MIQKKYMNKYIKYKQKYYALKIILQQNGGNGELTLENVKKIVEKNFSGSTYELSGDVISIVHECKSKSKLEFTIIISTKIMHINIIEKCDTNGTDVLKKIVEISRQIGLKSIELMDASNIKIGNVEISLSALCILANGVSWYNKHDFLSDKHVEDFNHNGPIRNYEIKQLIDEGIEKYYGGEITRLKERLEKLETGSIELRELIDKLNGSNKGEIK